MVPGNHLTRTTYGPGLLGSPKSTADSFVPAAFRTHLMSAGVLKSTAVRSMSAARVDAAGIAVINRAAPSIRAKPIEVMSSPVRKVHVIARAPAPAPAGRA